MPVLGGIKYLPALERKNKYQFLDDEQESLYLSLTVVDTGRGITEEQMHNLFQRFMQGGPKTYIQYGGSGLGLYISRQITEMLGGAMGVDSTPEKGSLFTFYVKTRRGERFGHREPSDSLLPAAIRANLDAALFDTSTNFLKRSPTGTDEHERIGSISQLSAMSTLGNLKILVVEDNLVNRRVLCQQLRNRQFVVESATHGLEALTRLKQTSIWKNGGLDRSFDVVLMDLEMPVMGGLECISKIRQAEEDGTISGHVPVIAVTANALSMHAEAAMKAGMDGITTKPYRMDDLVSQIEKLHH